MRELDDSPVQYFQVLKKQYMDYIKESAEAAKKSEDHENESDINMSGMNMSMVEDELEDMFEG